MILRASVVAALLACAQSALAQAPQYDLLLKGGRVIDPKNNIDDVRDVAIRGDRIAAVAPDLPASSARKTIDVSGLYVTPGLVDIHVHVFTQSAPGTSARISVVCLRPCWTRTKKCCPTWRPRESEE